MSHKTPNPAPKSHDDPNRITVPPPPAPPPKKYPWAPWAGIDLGIPIVAIDTSTLKPIPGAPGYYQGHLGTHRGRLTPEETEEEIRFRAAYEKTLKKFGGALKKLAE